MAALFIQLLVLAGQTFGQTEDDGVAGEELLPKCASLRPLRLKLKEL